MRVDLVPIAGALAFSSASVLANAMCVLLCTRDTRIRGVALSGLLVSAGALTLPIGLLLTARPLSVTADSAALNAVGVWTSNATFGLVLAALSVHFVGFRGGIVWWWLYAAGRSRDRDVGEAASRAWRSFGTPKDRLVGSAVAGLPLLLIWASGFAAASREPGLRPGVRAALRMAGWITGGPAVLVTVALAMCTLPMVFSKKNRLMAAAGSGLTARLASLLDAGLSVDATDRAGHTALHWAARKGQEEAVAFLIDRGASVDRRNRQGQTPVDVALQHEHDEIVRLLREAPKRNANRADR